MKTEVLRDTIRAQPFRPFRLVLANGERLHVPHPEWVWLLPSGRTVGWADQDDHYKLLDIGLLLGLEIDETVPSGTPAANSNGGE